FFFQAEDGIRDRNVTGVQTCALPISRRNPGHLGRRIWPNARGGWPISGQTRRPRPQPLRLHHLASRRRHPRRQNHRRDGRFWLRSEERRVGKECRYRWWPDREKEE